MENIELWISALLLVVILLMFLYLAMSDARFWKKSSMRWKDFAKHDTKLAKDLLEQCKDWNDLYDQLEHLFQEQKKDVDMLRDLNGGQWTKKQQYKH